MSPEMHGGPTRANSSADCVRLGRGQRLRFGAALVCLMAAGCYVPLPWPAHVAVRERFMHNGVFSSLRDAVAFYASRSTNPERWHPRGQKFDDVPPRYRGNVNTVSLPYNGRERDTPFLDDEDIDAIVAFLKTLTDEPYRSALAAQ